MDSRIQTLREEIYLETEETGISSFCVHLMTETQNLSEILCFYKTITELKKSQTCHSVARQFILPRLMCNVEIGLNKTGCRHKAFRKFTKPLAPSAPLHISHSPQQLQNLKLPTLNRVHI